MATSAPNAADAAPRAQQRLVLALQQLLRAPDATAIHRLVAGAARELAGADAGAMILRDGEFCQLIGEEAATPIWHGQRLPASACIGSWEALQTGELLVEDTALSPLLTQDASRAVAARSLLVVPVGAPATIAAIGVWWADARGPRPAHVPLLKALAEGCAGALALAGARADLQRRIGEQAGMLERAQAELQQHAITDSLTGLANRRGFYLLAQQALRHAKRRGVPCLLAVIDIDGLAQVNEGHGHAVGDALILDTARALRKTFRASDIIARMGSDEFAIAVLDPGDDATVIRQRINTRLEHFNKRSSKPYVMAVSLGVACSDPDAEGTVDELLARADDAMQEDKRSRKIMAGKSRRASAA